MASEPWYQASYRIAKRDGNKQRKNQANPSECTSS